MQPDTRDVPVTPERRAADLLDDLLDIAHALECAPDLEAILAAITKLKDVAAYERGRADEREACAKLAKGRHNKYCGPRDASASDGYNDACDDIDDAIRARTTEGQQHGR